MNAKRFADKQIAEIKRIVGKEKAVSALSGGVDSAVATVLAAKALGRRLKVIFLDDGLMRQDEPKSVKADFKKLGITVQIIDVKDTFTRVLKGLTDPEEKRKVFSDTFYKTFKKAVKATGAKYLIQGTIKADIIETKKSVKTQHNVLEQVGVDTKKKYSFTAIEPLKTLFKPGVRAVGRALGMPKKMTERMPFPGPGLLCRCLGEVTPERIAVVRKACRIVEEETLKFKPFQTFAVLLDDRATGLSKTGGRHFGQIVVIRCVESKNAMTAKATKLSRTVLDKTTRRILKEIPSVVKVLYDLSPKPPSTIEYI